MPRALARRARPCAPCPAPLRALPCVSQALAGRVAAWPSAMSQRRAPYRGRVPHAAGLVASLSRDTLQPFSLAFPMATVTIQCLYRDPACLPSQVSCNTQQCIVIQNPALQAPFCRNTVNCIAIQFASHPTSLPACNTIFVLQHTSTASAIQCLASKSQYPSQCIATPFQPTCCSHCNTPRRVAIQYSTYQALPICNTLIVLQYKILFFYNTIGQ